MTRLLAALPLVAAVASWEIVVEDAASGASTPAASSVRGTAAVKARVRPTGSTPNINFYCGLGVAANQIWYCPPGNTCTSWTQWGHAPGTPRQSSCSWVYLNACQVYTRADPPYHDWVAYMWFSRTISGPPVLGDRWCG